MKMTCYVHEDTNAGMQLAINRMVGEISGILDDVSPSIYLYGSLVRNDFRLGWSDIDILVLTEKEMDEEQAEKLVYLRQALLEKEPDNRYYRSFEGGMISLSAFLSGQNRRAVYWGTSGERITNGYTLDCFGMKDMLENGILLFGRDERKHMQPPDFSALHKGIQFHYDTIRKYARKTSRHLYSFGWMLDIARCIYTLRTGQLIAKTAAAEWALANHICPDEEAMKLALEVRKRPGKCQADAGIMDTAERMGSPIQRFADILERELMNHKGEE